MSIPPREYEAGGAANPPPRTEMIALADIRQDGHGLYFLEVRCPACGALLGKTFSMIARQLAENYEQVRLAAALTAQACPAGCHRDPGDRAIDVAVEIVRDEEPSRPEGARPRASHEFVGLRPPPGPFSEPQNGTVSPTRAAGGEREPPAQSR